MRTTSLGLAPLMSRPSKAIRPRRIGRIREIERSVVLLPAPFAPMSVTISPAWTSRLTCSSACTRP
jgi:hypothetical protein